MSKINAREFHDNVAHAIMKAHGCNEINGNCVKHNEGFVIGMCIISLKVANGFITAGLHNNPAAKFEFLKDLEFTFDEPKEDLSVANRKVQVIAEKLQKDALKSVKPWEDWDKSEAAQGMPYFINRAREILKLIEEA